MPVFSLIKVAYLSGFPELAHESIRLTRALTKSVLVIDDSSLARRTLRHILESAPYQVDEANDALAGLERYALAKGDYAIVFLDIVMAGMYGIGYP